MMFWNRYKLSSAQGSSLSPPFQILTPQPQRRPFSWRVTWKSDCSHLQEASYGVFFYATGWWDNKLKFSKYQKKSAILKSERVTYFSMRRQRQDEKSIFFKFASMAPPGHVLWFDYFDLAACNALVKQSRYPCCFILDVIVSFAGNQRTVHSFFEMEKSEGKAINDFNAKSLAEISTMQHASNIKCAWNPLLKLIWRQC